jgi:hypothetical protein
MRVYFLIIVIIFSSLALVDCSRTSTGGEIKGPSKMLIVAEVGNKKITSEEFFQDSTVQKALENVIKREIIHQEFQSRGLKMEPGKEDELWKKFTEMVGGGDEAATLQNIKDRGMTKDYVLVNLRMEYEMQEIFYNEYPVSDEEILADFNKNVRGNQLMFKTYVPEKADAPETITFEDIKEPFSENYKRRNMTDKGPQLLDEILTKFENKDLIKNYLHDEATQGLTRIEPKNQAETQPMRQAPIRKHEGKPPAEEGKDKSEKTPDENQSKDEGKDGE